MKIFFVNSHFNENRWNLLCFTKSSINFIWKIFVNKEITKSKLWVTEVQKLRL